MAMTEAPFSITHKLSNGDLLTGRAEDAEEMMRRIEEITLVMRYANELLVGGQPPAPARVAPTPASTSAPDQTATAIAALAEQGMLAPASLEERVDDWGNKYLRGNPDAGACEHGARIVKSGINKSGSPYKMYACVNETPFRVGPYNKENICKAAWPAKK
jgi:hypothetical protein